MRFLVCSLVVVTNTLLALAKTDMTIVYEWKYIDFVWDSQDMKQRAIDSGDYDYTQIVPMDVDKAPDGRVFLTFLGTYGTPAVLGTVSDQMGPSGPLIKPYPDWSYYGQRSCDLIRNPYRIAIDKCQRLWVLDNGWLESEPPNVCEKLNCGAQLHVFDLKSDRLINRIKIPDYITSNQNGAYLLATPIVETYGETCEDTTVYIADTWGMGLIIWNNGKWSRLENPRFQPDEGAKNITSGDDSVTWDAGIVTMDISPVIYPNEPRELYFHSLASFALHSAKTVDLKRTNDATTINFVDSKNNLLKSQAVGIAFSSEGTLFMGLSGAESAIACWNKYRPLEENYIVNVAQDRKRLQYVNGMKVIRGPASDDELWVLSNQFVSWTAGNIDHEKINFRILKSSVKKLTENTVCAMQNLC